MKVTPWPNVLPLWSQAPSLCPAGSLAQSWLKDTEPLQKHPDSRSFICNWGSRPIRNLDGPKPESSALLKVNKNNPRFDFCAVHLSSAQNINRLLCCQPTQSCLRPELNDKQQARP